ncbi:MAG: choice-of-anchor tandem repeat GloVer-containing protein [Candidatus Korobacteraceae bacterium]
MAHTKKRQVLHTLHHAAMAVLFNLFVFGIVAAQPAQAQTLQILHTFTGNGDGGEPFAGVTLDRAGNLYGTTSAGNVYKLTHHGSSWGLTNVYVFQGGTDGAEPYARVVFGPDGTLFGTTSAGGAHGAGTVFNLRPPATFCRTIQCPWSETVLYSFTGGSDGNGPQYGDLTFDAAGNIYGTTAYGGAGCSGFGGCGVVFELSRSGGGWTESVVHQFAGPDGQTPYSGVIFDSAGNLYGTTTSGGDDGGGTAYKLTPSGSGWTETILHSFGAGNDGADPYGGLAMDQQGGLFGTTFFGGTEDAGIAFELQPSGGSWSYSVLRNFDGEQGAFDTPTVDAAGNVYGTIFGGGSGGIGNVFKLTHGSGGWTYTDLHDFTGRDGVEPIGGVTLDSSGNIYGTTFYAVGEVWEITP